MIGEKPAADFLTIDWILGQFGENRPKAIKAYKQFVSEGYGADHSMKEIGDFLGMHYSSLSRVSRAVRKYESTKKNEKQKKKNVALQDATP